MWPTQTNCLWADVFHLVESKCHTTKKHVNIGSYGDPKDLPRVHRYHIWLRQINYKHSGLIHNLEITRHPEEIWWGMHVDKPILNILHRHCCRSPVCYVKFIDKGRLHCVKAGSHTDDGNRDHHARWIQDAATWECHSASHGCELTLGIHAFRIK